MIVYLKKKENVHIDNFIDKETQMDSKKLKSKNQFIDKKRIQFWLYYTPWVY